MIQYRDLAASLGQHDESDTPPPTIVKPSTRVKLTTEEAKQELFRQTLRVRAKRSLYFLAKFVLNAHREAGDNRLTAHFHKPLCDLVQSPPGPKQVILVPRGYLKTSICSVAYPVWRLVNDPAATILVASATATLAEHVVREIKQVFERNVIFRWLFPELIPEDFTKTKWTESEIVVPRPVSIKEPSIQAIGVGGTVVGHHFQVTIFDDLINEKHVASAELMLSVVEWHKYAVSLLVDPDRDRELVVGTRWAYNDLYQHLQDSGQFSVYIRSAVEGGQSTFPEKYPLDALAKVEERLGPYGYSANMLNNPTDPSRQIFRPEWCPEIAWNEDVSAKVRDYTKYVIVDPALSEKKDGSFTGYVLAAVGPDYDTLILEAIKRRWSVGQLIKRIFEDADRYDNIVFGIEMASLARALKYPIDQEMFKRGKFLRLQILQPDTTKSKEMRIRSLQPYFSNIVFKFIKGACKDLLDDIRAFPFGDGKYDALDALSYLPQMWTEGQVVSPPEPNPGDSPFVMANILNELQERGGGRGNDRFVLHRAALMGRN